MAPSLASVAVYWARPEALDAEGTARAEALLDEGERERRARFVFEKDRRLFLAAHALARAALSRHAVDVDPRDWRFVTGPHGRPEIASPAIAVPLRFNISHTDGLVACAIAVGRDVGVDVECETRRRAPLEIADRFFSPDEVRDLHALADEAQPERFFVYWTLKEAYIKARGLGLSLPLDRFSFHLEPGRPIRISVVPPVDDDPETWQFALDRPTPDHRLAVAVRRGSAPDLTIRVEAWLEA